LPGCTLPGSGTNMKRGLVMLLCLLSIPAATGAGAESRAERKARTEQRFYIATTRPRRNEAYLRRENINDLEVRELQAATRAVLPEAIVNIGGVSSDCPCEDGPGCSAQVWVVAYDPKETVGLMFTKTDGHWGIGPVQSWWLQYDALQQRRPSWLNEAKYVAWSEEQEALYAAFPSCAAQSP
jgi:hypothetical protein